MCSMSHCWKGQDRPLTGIAICSFEVKGDLTMEAKLVKILDRDVRVLRNKRVSLVRVLWRNSRIEEETREKESVMKQKFPRLFFNIGT